MKGFHMELGTDKEAATRYPPSFLAVELREWDLPCCWFFCCSVPQKRCSKLAAVECSATTRNLLEKLRDCYHLQNLLHAHTNNVGLRALMQYHCLGNGKDSKKFSTKRSVKTGASDIHEHGNNFQPSAGSTVLHAVCNPAIQNPHRISAKGNEGKVTRPAGSCEARGGGFRRLSKSKRRFQRRSTRGRRISSC